MRQALLAVAFGASLVALAAGEDTPPRKQPSPEPTLEEQQRRWDDGRRKRVAEQIKLLDSKEAETRGKAAERLGREGFDKYAAPAVPRLIEMLCDRQTYYEEHFSEEHELKKTRVSVCPAEKAVDALRSIGLPAAGPLLAALESDDPNVRSRAAQAITPMVGSDLFCNAVEPLCRVARDGDSQGRVAALSALVRMHEARVKPMLITALRDEESYVRVVAARGLREFPHIYGVIAPMSALADDPAPSVRCAVAATLGGVRDPQGKAAAALRKLLTDEVQYVRISAARSLWLQTKDAKAVKVLAEALRGDDLRARENAARAADECRSDELIAPLVEAFTSASYRQQDLMYQAGRALTKQGDRGLEAVLALLKSERWQVRLQAANALETSSDPRLVEPLLAALKDPHASVRGSAARARVWRPGQIRAIKPLLALLAGEDQSECSSAAMALARIGPDGVSSVVPVFRDRQRPVKTRRWALYCLSQAASESRDPQAIPAVIEGLDDFDAEIRRSARRCLARVAGRDLGADAQPWRDWWKQEPH